MEAHAASGAVIEIANVSAARAIEHAESMLGPVDKASLVSISALPPQVLAVQVGTR
jgi:hypothetical protein